MAAHSFIRLGEQLLYAYREGYPAEFAAVFRDDELVSDLEAPIYATTVKRMRERLHVLGFTSAAARRRLDAAYSEALEHEDDLEPIDAWLERVRILVTDSEHNVDDVPVWAAWAGDPRLILRLLVDVAPDDIEVALDLSDVVSRGYAPVREDLCAAAFAGLHGEEVYAPLIVLTEGSSDGEFLDAAIEILAPHLRGYVRFLDWGFKPEGSASALVRAVRAFAAAGVTNRVLALFDADSAGADALRSLDLGQLPANFRVRQLPVLSLALDYPTLGPGGLSSMDVNGLAVSIELFFGVDVLCRDTTSLTPVQWRGYVSAVGTYQGEVMDKPLLQDAFRRKVRAALARGGPSEKEDWTGMDALVGCIIGAFESSEPRSG